MVPTTWVSSGGDYANYTLGPVRYETCTINAPEVDAGETRHVVAFAGAVPNPATSASGALFAFTVPGVEGGDRVGVRMPSGTKDLYVTILSVLAAGAAYVPVDADDPDERAELVFGEAGVTAIVTDRRVIRPDRGERP